MTDGFEVCRCAKCSRPLQVVCPAGCKDPTEAIRKSKGPVPNPPSGKAPTLRRTRAAVGRKSPLPKTKVCRTCKAEKSIREFYLSQGYPFPDCKRCTLDKQRKAKAVA